MKIKFSLLILPLAGLAFAACSSDGDGGRDVTGNEIRFNASAPVAPRTVSTTGNLDNFRVTAFVAGKKYMDNLQVLKVDNVWTYSPIMYWPADETVNFFSYSPDNITHSTADDRMADILGYVNNGTTDFLYGVNMNESGTNTRMVKINFRHALSQVRFYLKRKAQDPPIRVDVTGVSLTNINNVGDFSFPRATTSASSATYGDWDEQTKPVDPVLYSGQPVTLTDNGKELNPGGYYFFIPQDLDGVGEDTVNGNFVKVTCAIYHQGTGTKVWPVGKEYGEIYFPLNTVDTHRQGIDEWEQGRAYVYNLTIGVPSGTGAIVFDVTVDEYSDFSETELVNK